MKNLIIGKGEVGNSLYEVVKGKHETYIKDLEDLEIEGIEVLNICFPYSEKFEEIVKGYQEKYKPKLTIIHSTVPVGTSRKLGAVHSPIHGKHPNLQKGIRTFTKYVGGERIDDVIKAVDFLTEAKIKAKVVSSPESSELSKILCTTYYGWNIMFEKEVHKICEQLNISFDDVYNWNKCYNEGYKKLKMGQFTRPVIEHTEGKIGGHCVINNTKLLDSFLTNTLKERNETY